MQGSGDGLHEGWNETWILGEDPVEEEPGPKNDKKDEDEKDENGGKHDREENACEHLRNATEPGLQQRASRGGFGP